MSPRKRISQRRRAGLAPLSPQAASNTLFASPANSSIDDNCTLRQTRMQSKPATTSANFTDISRDVCAAALASALTVTQAASPDVLTLENVPPQTAHRIPAPTPEARGSSPSSTASHSVLSGRGTFSAPRRSPQARSSAAESPVTPAAPSPLRNSFSPSVHYSEPTTHSRLSFSQSLPPHPPLDSVLSTVQELSHEPAEAFEQFGDEWGGAQEHDQEHEEWHDDDETDAGSRVFDSFQASFDNPVTAAGTPPPPSRQERDFAWATRGTHSPPRGRLQSSFRNAHNDAAAMELRSLAHLASLGGVAHRLAAPHSPVLQLRAEPEALPTTPPNKSVSAATEAVRAFTGRQVAAMRKLQQQRAAAKRAAEEAEAEKRRALEEAEAKKRAKEEAKKRAAEQAAAAAAAAKKAEEEAAAAAKAPAAAANPTTSAVQDAASAGQGSVSTDEFDLVGATQEFESLRKEADGLFGDERDERSEFEDLFETAERAAGSFVSTEEGIHKAASGFLQTIQSIPRVCPSDAALQQRLKLTLLADFAYLHVHRQGRQSVAANIFAQFAMDESRTKLLLRVSETHPELLRYLIGAVCQVVPELIGRQRAPRDSRLAPVTKSGAVNDMIEVAASLCLLADCCCFADQGKPQGKQLINSMWSILVRFVRDPLSLGDSVPLSIVVAWCAWSRCGPALNIRFPKSAPKLWAAIRTKLSPGEMARLLGNRATQCRLYIDAIESKLQADAATGFKCQCDRYHEISAS